MASNSNRHTGLIGSVLSLISKNDIRYEGVVYLYETIDSETTIGLKNARIYGTEGRRVHGPQIPQRDKVYEHIVFRARDIKAVQVKAFSHEMVEEMYGDPTIIQQHHSRVPFSSSAKNSGRSLIEESHSQDISVVTTRFNRETFPVYQPGIGVQSMRNLSSSTTTMPMPLPGYKVEYVHTPVGVSHHIPYNGQSGTAMSTSMLNQVQASYVQPSSTVSGPVPQESLLPSSPSVLEHQTSSVSYTDEFDFEAMNEKFKKYMEIVDIGMQNSKPAYAKDDFFDMISYGSHSQQATLNRFSERMGTDAESFGCFRQGPHQGDRGHQARHKHNIRGLPDRGWGY